jgi:hypothetical protein
MATFNCNLAVHPTLTAATVDTVTVTSAVSTVEVLNRDVTNAIYFRLDAVAPVVAAADNFVVLPGLARRVTIGPLHTVALISVGAAAYSVTVI